MPLPPYPVIVLPGITANNLRDEYPLPPETIWSVPTRDYERASLHPDNLRLEALEPARVRVDQLFEVVYSELIEELRYNLREEEDKTVPVFPFAYDWRQPLDDIELQLGEFITEVIERTKLLRHYDRAGYADEPKVNLVGHSMGGLIIAGYLERAGKTARVHKVATLAAPYRGSFEAVIKITTGTGDLGTSPPSSREREAARMTPALYHLLPSFKKGLEVDDGIPANLFNPDAWQKSIVDTIEEYVRLRGLERPNQREQANKLFKQMLDLGNKHRLRIDKLALPDVGLGVDDWLCVVGVNAETRVKLKIVKDGGRPQFSFRSEDRADSWLRRRTDPDILHRTGDGTVPLEGALPSFLPREKVVCVTPGDFGYWEMGDRALSRITGFHGLLPTMDMVHRLIVRHFTGRRDTHKNTWGWPAPGVEDAAWKPPMLLRNKNEDPSD